MALALAAAALMAVTAWAGCAVDDYGYGRRGYDRYYGYDYGDRGPRFTYRDGRRYPYGDVHAPYAYGDAYAPYGPRYRDWDPRIDEDWDRGIDEDWNPHIDEDW